MRSRRERGRGGSIGRKGEERWPEPKGRNEREQGEEKERKAKERGREVGKGREAGIRMLTRKGKEKEKGKGREDGVERPE